MKYPDFRYQSVRIQPESGRLLVRFQFAIDGLCEFAPGWSFPLPAGEPPREDDPVLRRLAFNLGMAELVSYWKPTCSPNVHIECGELDEPQRVFWKNLYFHGLGEFYYRNGLTPDPEKFMTMDNAERPAPPCGGNKTPGPAGQDGEPRDKTPGGLGPPPSLLKRVGKERLSIANCLVPIGGGKDSAVTLEVLRPLRERTRAYTINARAAQRDTCAAAGLPPERLLDARRTIDPNLLRLNAEGFLNGHTPFSAVVAFSSVLTAYLHGLAHVALSNESSANESTVPGSTVNHQYSKSYAFERDFRAYERAYLRSGVNYFSLLRPLSEYDIARLFARYPAYHSVFRSCNAGSKTDSWCGRCPKCLFVWLILSPFLERAALAEIFGRDLSADEALTPLLEQLTGIRPEKPFECVGSRAEVNYALRQTADKLLAQGQALPPLYAHWYKTVGDCPVSPPPELDSEHFVPDEFLELLKKEVARCGSSSAR